MVLFGRSFAQRDPDVNRGSHRFELLPDSRHGADCFRLCVAHDGGPVVPDSTASGRRIDGFGGAERVRARLPTQVSDRRCDIRFQIVLPQRNASAMHPQEPDMAGMENRSAGNSGLQPWRRYRQRARSGMQRALKIDRPAGVGLSWSLRRCCSWTSPPAGSTRRQLRAAPGPLAMPRARPSRCGEPPAIR